MGASRIVIAGGGFGGAFTARRLLARGRGRFDLALIDRENYFVFQPLLPEVAGGGVNVLDAVTPLRQMLPGIRLYRAQMRAIDLAARKVALLHGDMATTVELGFDHLVMAFGQVVDLSRIQGLAEHAFTVKEAADTFVLRNHIIGCLEQASLLEDIPARRRLLTFVVVGGGFSGVEVMGEIEEMVRRGLRFYSVIDRTEPRFVLVEFQNRILPEVEADLADYAIAVLKRRGVETMLGRGVASAAASAVELDDGTVIPTATIVATIGNAPSPLLADLPVAKERGRIVVDRCLRVPGQDGVWCLGDAALVPVADGFAPPTAQAAVQQARRLADNLLAALDGRSPEPFVYRPRGALASLGGRKGVGKVYGTKFSGTLAWLIWRFAYLAMLPSWVTRMRVGVDQFLDLFLPRNIVQTQQPTRPPTRFVRHRAGDVVIDPGQMGDGVHLVLEGGYDAVRPDGAVVARFGVGDRFGVQAILEHRANRSAIRASVDSACFVLDRADFERIVEAFRIARGDGP